LQQQDLILWPVRLTIEAWLIYHLASHKKETVLKKLVLFLVSISVTIGTLYTVPTTFISPDQITGAPFSIDAPGLYVLTDDVSYGTSGGTSVTINSNDVTFDLNGKTINNSNPGGTENGISIVSTYTNITIKNGALRIFDGTAISVNSGSLDLFFEDLTIVGAGITTGTGLYFDGIASATTRTNGIQIKNCRISNCLHGIAATAVDTTSIDCSRFINNSIGIHATDCSLWMLENCQASFNTVSSGQGLGVLASNCTCWTLKSSDFNGNSGSSSSAGAEFNTQNNGSSGAHTIEHCMFCANFSSGGDSEGLNLVNTSSATIKNCSFNGNFSVTGTVVGLSVTGSGISIENCYANGNFALGTGAVAAQGFSSTGTAHIYKNCMASNNFTAGTETGLGIMLQGQRHIVQNCTTGANLSEGGIAIGIFSSSTSGCLIKNCTTTANSGNSSANSRGFQGNTAGSDLWIGNVAFGQGTNYFSTVIPYLTIAATGPYPVGPTFDERNLANLSFE
jgi:hypothetical protein